MHILIRSIFSAWYVR